MLSDQYLSGGWRPLSELEEGMLNIYQPRSQTHAKTKHDWQKFEAVPPDESNRQISHHVS